MVVVFWCGVVATPQPTPGIWYNLLNAHLPFLSQHLLAVSPESASISRFVARSLGFEELLGFGEGNSDETDSDGDTS